MCDELYRLRRTSPALYYSATLPRNESLNVEL